MSVVANQWLGPNHDLKGLKNQAMAQNGNTLSQHRVRKNKTTEGLVGNLHKRPIGLF